MGQLTKKANTSRRSEMKKNKTSEAEKERWKKSAFERKGQKAVLL